MMTRELWSILGTETCQELIHLKLTPPRACRVPLYLSWEEPRWVQKTSLALAEAKKVMPVPLMPVVLQGTQEVG